MNTLSLFVIVLYLLIVFQTSPVYSCPSTCKCRGKASKCGPGFSSSSLIGLDSATEHLGISGSDSQQNILSTIHRSDFQSLRSLFTLLVTFSNVQHVEDGAFSDLSQLRILNLANNDIRNLSAMSFKGLTQLVSLDLSSNKNCAVSKTVFRYVTSVQDLNIGDMNIKVLNHGLFDYVPKLKKLRLYSNGLTQISADVFSPLLQLEFIDVSFNNLSTLPIELEPVFLKLRQLNLAENPWHCNCQLLWFRRLPLAMKQSIVDLKDTICHGPDNLKYLSFNDIPESLLRCIPIKIRQCENKSLSIEEQEFVSLSCVFEGDPPPEIKWIRPDGYEIDGRGKIDGYYEIFGNGTLSISHVSGNDDGEWMVSAYNKTTHADKRININVISLSTSTQPTSTMSKPTTLETTVTRMSVTAHASSSTQGRPKSGSLSLSPSGHYQTMIFTALILMYILYTLQ